MAASSEEKRRIRELLIEIENLTGWRVDRSGRHHTIFPPDGQKIICVPCTPSDHRWRMNLRAEIRRAGHDPKALA